MWHGVIRGEARLYRLIWERHRDRVFLYLIRAGNAPVDAEDLTATAFLELWRRRRSVRFVDGSLLPWLLVTALNVHRNAARAEGRYRRFLEALPPPRDEPDPAEVFDPMDAVRNARVREVMASARPADAHLLAMTVLEEMTLREAAAALGLTESAAKMRLSRLRARISAVVPAHPLAEGDLR